MKRRVSRMQRRAALTLMEVMLVLVILGILGSMAVTFIAGAQRDALMRTTKAEIDTLVQAVDMYQMHMFAFPQSEGLQALLERPSSDSNQRWRGPYIKPNNDLLDPWGNQYELTIEDLGLGNNQQRVVIKSAGPDGSMGTADDVSSDQQF